MSVYQRFYIDIRLGEDKNVGDLIVDILGGDGWIALNDTGEILAPVEVVIGPEADYIVPTRTEYGSVISDSNRTGRWWWLDSLVDFDSSEARALAHALKTCSSVNRFAVDTDACESAWEPAAIVNDAHYLLSFNGNRRM